MTTTFYNDPAYQTVRSIRTELTEELSRNVQMWRQAYDSGWMDTAEYHHARNNVLRDKLNAVLVVLDMIEERYRVVPGR